MKGSAHSLAQSEEGRAFLQRRVALFALILGAVGGAFYAFRVLARLTAGQPRDLVHESMIAHLVGATVMLGVWASMRSGERSLRSIRVVDVSGLTTSCAAYGVMVLHMPQAFRPDLTLLLIYALLILSRAVLIPSTWQRTAGLSALLGLILAGISFWAFDPADPEFAAALTDFPSDFEASIAVALTLNAIMWWLGLAGLATVTSAVIYGLRRQMSEAKRLGQYALVRKLGEGGMGVVYEAKHAMLRRPTAVKLLLPERVGDQSLARFEREVRATAALSHPNTITVFDYGRTPDGVFYYAMEYLEGGTLGDVVKLDGPMPPGRAVFVLHQVAGALAEAHEAGLVHRDVKPDNILLTETGWMADLAKVVDFGLVKELEGGVGLTREETIVGTPQYMAPEVIRSSGDPDPRSDLYAFGCVAYYLLTGAHVFEADTIVEMCSLHLTEPPVPPSVKADGLSEELERLVLACLEKKPQDRPESAQEIQQWLEVLPEFGTWRREHARRWWQQLGPDLATVREESSLGTADTLAIDVAQRS